MAVSHPAGTADQNVAVSAPFEFTRRSDDGTLQRTQNVAELFGGDDVSNECWLFVGPTR